jgi:hypothetical protein
MLVGHRDRIRNATLHSGGVFLAGQVAALLTAGLSRAETASGGS